MLSPPQNSAGSFAYRFIGIGYGGYLLQTFCTHLPFAPKRPHKRSAHCTHTKHTVHSSH